MSGNPQQLAPPITTDSAITGPPPSTVSRPTFSVDDFVAGRFRIVRFIARGGMGELYESLDLELGQPVALKTIRSEVAQDERAIRRFKREVYLARQVTHPHICRIFDLFQHQPDAVVPGGPRPPIVFVTMELLRGETLAERLKHAGRLSIADAAPLARQMASALDAAHKIGVVHRDFKCSNVMLIDASEAGAPPRAVVTDFGLALRPDDASGGDGSLSATGEIVGTPDYMAPEQLRGADVTPATDIYALGLVLYEMVTGLRPFASPTPIVAIARRLSEAPAPPRSLVTDLDARWDAAIMKCLALDPADRFPDAIGVVQALDAAPTRARAPRTVRIVAGVLLLAALLALTYAAGVRVGPPEDGASPLAGVAAAAPRRSVAVLGFRNASSRQEAAWLSTAFSEMLTTELAAGQALRTIPGENVERMKIELALADVEAYAPDTLSRIHRRLDTDLVVFGSYVAVGEGADASIRLDVHLQDPAAGRTIAQLSETGREIDLIDLVARTGRRLRQTLDVETHVSPSIAAELRASQPSTPEAARLYAEGLARLRRFDALAARELLERAVAADPKFPMAHSALALAWSTLGYDERAASAAARAFELSAGLSREERLSVEASYRATARSWKQAIEIYQSLWRFFPDDVEYGLRLIDAQIASSSAKEAMASIDALRVHQPPLDDPRIDLAESRAAETLSDFARMRTAAAVAAARGEAQGAKLLTARARLQEGSAELRTGNPEKAIALFEQARVIYEQADDRGGMARALNSLGTALADYRDVAGGIQAYQDALRIARAIGDQATVTSALNNLAVQRRRAGDLNGSLKLNRETLEIRRTLGDRAMIAISLNNIGNVLLDLGDLAGAAAHYKEAADMHREIGDRRGLARALNNSAVALLYQGSLREAKAVNEEALAIRRAINDPASVGISLHNIGEIQWRQGDLAAAEKTFAEVLAIQRPLDARRSIGYALHILGEALFDKGAFGEARAAHQEALEVRNRLGEKGTAAESRLALGEIALEEGRDAEAETFAREALPVFEAQKATTNEALAHGLIARAIHARRAPGALREIERARTLVRESQNVLSRLPVLIAAARLEGEIDPRRAKASAETLEALRAQAVQSGLARFEMEARFALAVVERRIDPAAAAARLAALDRDARARGFGRFTRRASGEPRS